jgi:protein-tyrosine phosphatase
MNTSGHSMGFVDIHTHILPGVNDGPKTVEEAMGMLKSAAESGASVMVATPHSGPKALWSDVKSLREQCQGLRDLVEREQLPIEIVLGMENILEVDLAEQAEKGKALTINNGAYILVEMPFTLLPNYWEEALFNLQIVGLRPIIAHAELQQQFQGKPELLDRPVNRGVLVQVTAGSLVGNFGSKAKKAAQNMIKREFAHVIASDTHRPEGPRGPGLRAGFDELKKLVGEQGAARMMRKMPASIVGMSAPG